MNVFIRVDGKLRKYEANGIPHDSAIEMVAKHVNDESSVKRNCSIPLALIQGGKHD